MPSVKSREVSRFDSCLLYADITAYAKKPPRNERFSHTQTQNANKMRIPRL